jgi:hypothetical protein
VIKREFMIFFLLFAVADEAAAAALREVGLAGRWPLLQVPSGPELLVGLRVPRNQAMTAPMLGTAAPNAVARTGIGRCSQAIASRGSGSRLAGTMMASAVPSESQISQARHRTHPG